MAKNRRENWERKSWEPPGKTHLHFYKKKNMSAAAWKPTRLRQPAAYGRHSDRLHGVPACPRARGCRGEIFVTQNVPPSPLQGLDAPRCRWPAPALEPSHAVRVPGHVPVGPHACHAHRHPGEPPAVAGYAQVGARLAGELERGGSSLSGSSRWKFPQVLARESPTAPEADVEPLALVAGNCSHTHLNFQPPQQPVAARSWHELAAGWRSPSFCTFHALLCRCLPVP